MITDNMFSVSETRKEKIVEANNWRKRPRQHIVWTKTWMLQFLVNKYPIFRPTKEEVNLLVTKIPGTTQAEIKTFFLNYGRSGKNERFKDMKQLVKELASKGNIEEKAESSGEIEDNTEDTMPSKECKMDCTEDSPEYVDAEMSVDTIHVNMETTEADVTTGTDDKTENSPNSAVIPPSEYSNCSNE